MLISREIPCFSRGRCSETTGTTGTDEDETWWKMMKMCKGWVFFFLWVKLVSSPRSSRTKNLRWVWSTERIQDASCTGWLSVPNFGMSLQWSDWLEPRIPGILKPSETSCSMSKLRNNLWEQLTREIPTRVPVKNATHWSANSHA